MVGYGIEPRCRIDSVGRVRQQSPLEVGIDPGARDDARPDMRADFGLEILDDLIEGGWVDVALLGQDRFECLHSKLHLRELGAMIVVVRVVCRHGRPLLATSRRLAQPAVRFNSAWRSGWRA